MLIVSLFDFTGNAGRPWAEAGHQVLCLDILHKGFTVESFEGGGAIVYQSADLSNRAWVEIVARMSPGMIFSFPPCTDLAVSGALWFASKERKNPGTRERAMALVYQCRDIGEAAGCPYYIENPVSVISTEWRQSDYRWNPCDFSGYLPEGDKHPRHPDILPERDRYNKKTCVWVGGGWALPPRRYIKPIDEKGVSPILKKLGGNSNRTKSIRSETPRGFSLACFLDYQNKDT